MTRLLILAVLLVCGSPPLFAATTVVRGTDPGKQIMRGSIVTPDGSVLEGELVIEGDTITCVAADCPDPPGASIFTVTDAFIFPGFIDAHNHVAYNVLPKWTPPRLYQNRGQWQASVAYKAFKAPYANLKDNAKLFCEMVKWGEVAALISGITSVQGTAPNQLCFTGLVRNIENQHELGLPASHIRTSILDIRSFKGTVDWTKTKSFVVHLAEGIDERSRKEFDTLKTLKLLQRGTAIIHGTAFGDPEFEQMGAVGAKLIWSPQSNLSLYAATTNIPLARKHGIEVSLGVDWNASGSDTLFDELRVAQQVNEELWAGAIPPNEWVAMVTSNPARALAVDHLIGSLQADRKADITVVRARADDPGESLSQNHLADVETVWIGGELQYGTSAVVQEARPDACGEVIVQGATKRLCVDSPLLASALGKRFPYLVPVVR
jgi:cytosine/adenosine deaminase-related metal-dependent hydrolase